MPKAAVCVGLNEPLEIQDLDLDAPHAGEIRLRMGASGVCHSDLSIQNGTLMGALPMVLGHEGAGVVEELGEGVTGLDVGDHVVVSWVPQCGQCFFCQRGQGFLCEAGQMAMVTGGLLDGTTRFSRGGEPIKQMACSGTFSEQAIIPAIGAVKIPKDVPLEIGALIGCGGVGLNVIQGARIAGAAEIIAIDMLPNKLDMAKEFGATTLVNAGDGDPVAQVMDLTEQRGVDVAFEVIGLKQTIEQTLMMTRRGGEAILVGVPRMEVMLELPAFFGVVLMSKSIKGCWYGSSNVQKDVPRLLEYYKSGELKLDELISRRIRVDDVNDAFTAMEAGEVARSVIQY
jgi:Zn-dependent alcohol dehydrogenase